MTLGCKVNQAESLDIESALKIGGHEIIPISDRPDVCIINTCTVTSKSDYQSRQLIRRAHRVGAKVIVTGCYSELYPELIRSMEGVVDVVGNDRKRSIIERFASGVSTESVLRSPRRSRFFLKIQDGCSHYCSYCAIRAARGRSRSIKPDEVIRRILAAEGCGYNEIVLTGIHLGLYGLDLEPKVKLSDLVITTLKICKIKRLRLSSLEVNEVDDRLMELFSDERICRHLHIPLQSGDDNILKAMNRCYTTRLFSRKIEKIARKVPGIALGTDIIAGFPGEGEHEFQNTFNLVDSLPFSYVHAFPFSSRPGTKAEMLPGTVRADIKKNRVHAMESLSNRKKFAYASYFIGKTVDVLLEDSDSAGNILGTTGNYLKITLTMPSYARGAIVRVYIEGYDNGRLRGTPLIPTTI